MGQARWRVARPRAPLPVSTACPPLTTGAQRTMQRVCWRACFIALLARVPSVCGTERQCRWAALAAPLPRHSSRWCSVIRVIGSMVLGRDSLRLAEAYFRGDIDIEGDFFEALRLKDHLQQIRLSWGDPLRVLPQAIRLLFAADPASQAVHIAPFRPDQVKAHSRSENRAAVQFHYDLSNAFYALWLDPAMVYSCAYFGSPSDSLEAAQAAKLDLICRKLRLRPGERLLDIGCGWGALVIHAAKHYGVHAHGVTLSREQLVLAQERIDRAGLQDRVTVELRDYRDLDGVSSYDKVSSVGMFEHVGLDNLPTYFAAVHRLLKPAGLFLNHGITHDVEGWKETLSTQFINRYIFPDGQLDTVSNVQRVMEASRFEIEDVQSLRSHYAMTLRHWVGRLQSHHVQALQHVNEPTYRVWRLYMAACALEFESGEIGVYQVLATKRDGRLSPLPLTRQDLCAPQADRLCMNHTERTP